MIASKRQLICNEKHQQSECKTSLSSPPKHSPPAYNFYFFSVLFEVKIPYECELDVEKTHNCRQFESLKNRLMGKFFPLCVSLNCHRKTAKCCFVCRCSLFFPFCCRRHHYLASYLHLKSLPRARLWVGAWTIKKCFNNHERNCPEIDFFSCSLVWYDSSAFQTSRWVIKFRARMINPMISPHLTGPWVSSRTMP